ncbi:hypothetical protein [Maribacter sp.]|uniref:hypothetical protein n=1 Tax=Maribacter sp. TaxID=1897614 RepID=UPI0025BF7F7A|nr:hypothetical protein [Maribacter sp.]
MKYWSIYIIIILLGACGYLGYSRANKNNYIKELKTNQFQLLQEKDAQIVNLRIGQKEFLTQIDTRFAYLHQVLDSASIKQKNIEKIVIQKIYYKDSTHNKISLETVLKGIENSVAITQDFTDKSNCLTINGQVSYNGKDLSVNILEREFNSETQTVSHVKRKQWKWLFLKSRFLGRRQIKVTTFNACGKTKTLILEKKKGLWQKN